MKQEQQALLAVSFGAAAAQARQLEIGGVEEALRRRLPQLPFFRAYTSPTIRRILRSREGSAPPSLEEALEEQASAGIQRLYVAVTHLLPGYEYDAIVRTAEDFRPRFSQLAVSRPLLGDTVMVRALARVLMERWPPRPGQAVVLVGHGTAHPGNLVYSALQGVFCLAGRSDLLVGTIEGWPGPAELLPALERQQVRQVLLVPLLLTAGAHVREDIAGPGPDSWRSTLERSGLQVEPVLTGLGRLPQVQELYVRRLEEIL